MLAVVSGILIASLIVGDDDGSTGGDAFPAIRAWLYVAIVASAYIVSRGLAKAGSRDPTGPIATTVLAATTTTKRAIHRGPAFWGLLAAAPRSCIGLRARSKRRASAFGAQRKPDLATLRPHPHG